jgi:hypothetical protein
MGSEEQLLLTHLSIPLFSLDPTLNFFISFCRSPIHFILLPINKPHRYNFVSFVFVDYKLFP